MVNAGGVVNSQEQCRYWETVIDTMADGLLVVDPDGIIVSTNRALEEITGYERAELIGRTCAALDFDGCHKARAEGGGKHCRLFADGQVRRCRCHLKRRDGTLLPVIKNAAVLRDDQGQVIGAVETLTDLSEVAAREAVITQLREELEEKDVFHGMIGRSPAMRRVFGLIESAAPSEAPVVIQGESGVGKELAAAAIHHLSPRRNGPFIRVNCSALNENLLESELFGHVKGAFTGAEKARQGRFEAASGGDVFLDEIGDLSPAIQLKLLRVLQEKEIERVGAHQPVRVDVRVISATNRDLAQLMAEGRFRADLYYRVAVIPIHLPPLRERREDIPLLVERLVRRLALRTGKDITGVSRPAMDLLASHAWPGNVRELINFLEYAFVLCPGGRIEPEHLPALRRDVPAGPAAPEPDRAERERILDALRRSGGNKAQAARLLGMSRVTLWKRLKILGVSVDRTIASGG